MFVTLYGSHLLHILHISATEIFACCVCSGLADTPVATITTVLVLGILLYYGSFPWWLVLEFRADSSLYGQLIIAGDNTIAF